MSNCQIEGARAVSMRIRAALGCDEAPKPDAAENVSRARLCVYVQAFAMC